MTSASTALFVTVPNVFIPSEIKWSLDSKSWHVNLLTLAAPGQRQDVIRLRAKSWEGPDGLRAEILKRWPTAAFSKTGAAQPGSVEEAKAAYEASKPVTQAEIQSCMQVLKRRYNLAEGQLCTREMALTCLSVKQVDAIFSREDEAKRSQDVDAMSADDKLQITKEAVLQFMRETPELAAAPRFWTYNNQGNWLTLLEYFKAKGLDLPTKDDVGRAYRYLRDNGHLQLVEVLKRSEETQRAKPFHAEALTTSTTVSPAQIAAAKRKLARFRGYPITDELALSAGCTQAEIDAIRAELDNARAIDQETLKATVRAGFDKTGKTWRQQ